MMSAEPTLSHRREDTQPDHRDTNNQPKYVKHKHPRYNRSNEPRYKSTTKSRYNRSNSLGWSDAVSEPFTVTNAGEDMTDMFTIANGGQSLDPQTRPSMDVPQTPPSPNAPHMPSSTNGPHTLPTRNVPQMPPSTNVPQTPTSTDVPHTPTSTNAPHMPFSTRAPEEASSKPESPTSRDVRTLRTEVSVEVTVTVSSPVIVSDVFRFPEPPPAFGGAKPSETASTQSNYKPQPATRQKPCEHIDPTIAQANNRTVEAAEKFISCPAKPSPAAPAESDELNLRSVPDPRETDYLKVKPTTLAGPAAMQVSESLEGDSVNGKSDPQLSLQSDVAHSESDCSCGKTALKISPGDSAEDLPSYNEAVAENKKLGGDAEKELEDRPDAKETDKLAAISDQPGAIYGDQQQYWDASDEDRAKKLNKRTRDCWQRTHVEKIKCPERLKEKPSTSQLVEVTLTRAKKNVPFGFKFVHGSIRGKERWKHDKEFYVSTIIPDQIAYTDSEMRKGDTIEKVNGKKIHELGCDDIEDMFRMALKVKLRLRRYITERQLCCESIKV